MPSKYYLEKALQYVHDIPGLKEYSGKPCVYVRELGDGSFYVGRSNALHMRYRATELAQIIYYEEFEYPKDTIPRETDLMREFLEVGLRLGNKTRFVVTSPCEEGERDLVSELLHYGK